MTLQTQSILPSLTIIMPAYQEAAALEPSYETLTRALGKAGVSDYEFLILTAIAKDGTHDGTPDIANRIAERDSRVRSVNYNFYTSLGYRYREGLRMATKKYVTMMPAHNLMEESSQVFVLEQMGKADAIIAYIQNPEARPLRARFVSRGFVLLCNILFGLCLRYYNGVTILRTDLVRAVPMTADNHAYMAEILVYLLKSHASYVQVPQVLKFSSRTGKEFHLQSAMISFQTLMSLFWKIHFRRVRIKI